MGYVLLGIKSICFFNYMILDNKMHSDRLYVCVCDVYYWIHK